jgi:hypothetical protein
MKAAIVMFGLFASLSACVSPALVQSLPSAPQFSNAPLQAPPLRRQPLPGIVTGEEVELTGIYAVDDQGAHFLLRNGSRLDLTHQSGAFVKTLPSVEHRSTLRIRGRLMPARTTFSDAELVPRNYYRV